MSMISNATNRVKRSPVRKASTTPGGKGLIDGVKGREGLIVVALAHCEGQHPQQRSRRNAQHESRETIGDQRDSNRGVPAANVQHGGSVRIDVSQDDQTDDQRRGRGGQRNQTLEHQAPYQQRERHGSQRDHQEKDDQDVHAHFPPVSRGNATILQVVFDRIGTGQYLAPVGQCQQEGRDAERDDQSGQDERLRQRVGQHLIAAVEDRSGAGRPAGTEEKQVGAVADAGRAR